jgi:hypothetical protein
MIKGMLAAGPDEPDPDQPARLRAVRNLGTVHCLGLRDQARHRSRSPDQPHQKAVAMIA